MKKLTLVLGLCFMPLMAQAAMTGKLNLTPSIQPMVLRELHDGQWLAGIIHPDVWHLDYQGTNSPLHLWDNSQVLHAGFFTAWNAESGNVSYGPTLGVNLPAPVGPVLQSIGDALGFGQTIKPAALLASMISIDGFGGYRPNHTPDVIGNWVYGFGAALKIQFGAAELQSGVGAP